MTGFLGHVVRGSFESLGKVIAPWPGIVLVALGGGAVVGPPHASTATAAPPPTQPTATAIDCSQHKFAQP